MNAGHVVSITALLCLAVVDVGRGEGPKAAAPAGPPPPPIVAREDGRLIIPAGSLQAAGQPLIKCVVSGAAPLAVTAVAFSPNGKLLAAGDARGVVLWDLEGAKLLKRVGGGQLTAVHALAFSKDGGLLAVGEGSAGVSGDVRLFEVASGRQAALLEGPKDVVYALAISGEANLLACGAADGKAYVWNLADKRLVTTIQEHGDWVLGVAFSPDGKLLATGGADKSTQVWEVGTWKSANKFLQAETVQATAFSPDGKLLVWAVAGTQQPMLRWREPLDPPENPKDSKKERVIPQVRNTDINGGAPLAMVFGALRLPKQNPQPRLVVACTDKTVKVYNDGGGQMSSLTGHGDWVYCVAMSADGTLFASGSADGTLKLWSGTEMRPLATLALLDDKEGWLILTAPGYFAASTPAAIGWDKLKLTLAPERLAELLAKPELVRDCLAGKNVAPPALK